MTNVFIISAPSGSGKSTLVARVLAADSRLLFSISHTTRAPRGNEKPGESYHFVSREEQVVQAEVESGDSVDLAPGTKIGQEGLHHGPAFDGQAAGQFPWGPSSAGDEFVNEHPMR